MSRKFKVLSKKSKKRLSEPKKHLTERNHQPEIIDYTFTKCFEPKLDKKEDLQKIILSRTFKPNYISKSIFTS